MTDMQDEGVLALFAARNHAVVSTLNSDGSTHSAVVWIDLIGGQPAVNSAVGRAWPTHLERDPRITVLVYDEKDPFDYVEVRGTAQGTTEGADEHIDRLAKKYLDVDRYPYHQPGDQRITYVVTPTRVRHQKQG